MKSLQKTVSLLKNWFPAPLNTLASTCHRPYCLSVLSSPSPLETPHHHDRNGRRSSHTPYALPTSALERISFSTLSDGTNLHQLLIKKKGVLTSLMAWPKKESSGWGLNQSSRSAITRFQSQLNMICANEASAGIRAPGRSIDCEELIQMVEEGVRFTLIDVRDRKEAELNGSIQDAKLIPLPELKSALLMEEDEFLMEYGFPKPMKSDRNIVFYGQGAVKSNSAIEIAGKLGYRGVLRMAGGYDEWIEKTHLDGRI